MQRYLASAISLLALAACSRPESSGQPSAASPAGAPPAPAALVSGVDLQYVDGSVRAGDDIYRHLNGKWLDTFQIPADKGIYNGFSIIDDQADEQLRGIIEGAGAPGAPGAPVDADARKIADLYASFMDNAKLDELGIKPVLPQFAAIDAIKSTAEFPALIAHLNSTSAGGAPYDFGVTQDARNSSKYAVVIGQSGLGMPDRDYYLKDDAKLKEARVKYIAHIEKMLGMAGLQNGKDTAAAILKLETALARIQWTKVQNRDPIKTYNKTALLDLPKLMPGYDWKAYTGGLGIDGKVDYVIVQQPSYFKALAGMIAATPLPVWKEYFKWHVLATAAPYLSKPFADERFAFAGTAVRGVPEDRPRWKRGVELVDGAIGEALGKLYVAKYFPPEKKARIEALINNLIEAYRRDIDTLEWMGPETKKGAQEKLSKLVTKIGYPKKWRDYTALKIARDDLLGNVNRANAFENQRNIDKLGKPIDREEWEMTPQTVNAYYEPLKNEIVFPAAILQPPFFNVKADDAVNYGSIGGVIGHEISHGFDDEGSQFDAAGNLHDWFTKDDHARFAAKTKALVEQYNAYEPVPGFHVNGALTLGENIADNSGLAIAYKAYKISLGGKEAPVLDGLSGDQRFFYGWVQVWRGKARDNEAIARIKTDPHSPPAVRGTVPILNQAGFYDAFGVKVGDKMFTPPERRVTIW
jgi:putative endopeptidase